MSYLEQAWRTALAVCPCCHYPKRDENTREDGIPDGEKTEITFTCGAAVFIGDNDRASTSSACPNAMDDALGALLENVETAAEIAEDEAS
jgi:hypothetical protein